MKQLATYLLSILTGLVLVVSSPLSATAQAVLAPGLANLVERPGTQDSIVHVVVFLDREGDELVRKAPAQALSRGERVRQVTSDLKKGRVRADQAVAALLGQYARSEVKRYWIAPAYAAAVPAGMLVEIAAIDGVRLVVEDVPVSLIEPVEIRDAGGELAATVAQPLQQLKVPVLWQQGLTGRGRLVCSFDTGVKYDHAALLGKWRGNSAPLSEVWFSKVNPTGLPADAVGHGTHTMGIMLGSEGADTIGVAPEAEWITAGVIDQGRPLSTTIADILEAFEWALDPDGNAATTDDVPDVILNSWGIPKGLFVPCDQTFATVIQNVEAAGVVVIFAAGNEGPYAISMRNPADMANGPLNTFSVGAVDANNLVAGFSSRGPASCDGVSIKPEVVAPGVSIRSSYRDGGYRTLSGTSMAAPYIAGLVALVRQYNPDVTVDQIKHAFLAAATDLGDAGEDNAYGHGMLDASRLLDYIPDPQVPDFSISGVAVSGDGVASPGEQFDLAITLRNPAGNVDHVQATLVSQAGMGVTVEAGQANYLFGGDLVSAVNNTPLTASFSDTLYNGQTAEFALVIAYEHNATAVVDTLPFAVAVGLAPRGTFATHQTPQMELTVSDFGMFGLAPGSIYNVRGAGFKVSGAENVLYEAGLILGRNSLQISTGVRGATGGFAASDFVPVSALSDELAGSDGGRRRFARYNDQAAGIRIPITVSQETLCYPGVSQNGLLIVKFRLVNTTLEAITGLRFGLLVDYDQLGAETVVYDAGLNMVMQAGESGPQGALVGLDRVTSFHAFDNGATAKRGFSEAELFNILTQTGVDLGEAQSDDRFFIASAGPFSIPARDSVTVALAFVGGLTASEVRANASAARQLYDQATDVNDERPEGLPVAFELHQNYPNPFNPTTTISFELPRASEVSLKIYNSLGQEVTVLQEGRLPAGQHAVDWDAGSGLASGVYFYRLAAEGIQQTRKMVLLK